MQPPFVSNQDHRCSLEHHDPWLVLGKGDHQSKRPPHILPYIMQTPRKSERDAILHRSLQGTVTSFTRMRIKS